ncbi:MAG: fimbrillin family protein [Prevotella sp.]|nr:fimbrillin family protein [Prevotella sp.]MBO5156315.1 fimbrillin family protein [Prevotella sp.]
MKKYYFLMALAATAMMSACGNDNENEFAPQTTGEKVSFFVDNGPITRTSVNTADASTKFVENDEIGIFATGGAVASNVGYKVGSGTDGALAPIGGSDIEWSTAAAGNFYAYYPYAAGSMTDKVTFTVTDQTDATTFNKNDFMVATATNVTNKGAIKFKFGHGLSLVQVVLSGSMAADATEVTLTAKPTVEWTFASGTFATSGEATAIKMWKIDANAQTYWAMVPAQTIATTAFVNITAGGKNYTYTPSADITLTTAKSKKFNLQLGEAGQAISVSTEIDTDGWAPDGEVTGNTEEEQYKPIELIPAGTITAETVFATRKDRQSCEAGWNSVTGSGNATINFDENEGALAITRTGGNWTNGTAFYCTTAGLAKKATYTLKFQVKTTELVANDQDLRYAVMTKVGSDKFFITGGSTTKYQKASTDSYTNIMIDVDLSKITASDVASAVEPTADELNQIVIYFTPKNPTGGTFYIKELTFIEKVVTE